MFDVVISIFLNCAASSPASPSITQPHTVSPSKTSIIHEEIVDIGGKRKKVADVWSHAKKIIRRNDKNEVTAVVAICNYCKTEVPAHSKTHGNNGIDGHVKKCKKNPHNAVKSSQPILTQSSMNNALTPHIFCQKKLEDKVVAFVVKDEMPFRVVEGAGFVEMMKEAQPRFKIPNRKKIASLVWDLYALEMAKIKSVIGDQRFKKVFGRMAENVQFVEYFEEVDGSEKKKRVGPPMEKDWEKAQVFVNFLKRFHDTTLQLSATKKTTSPLIWEEIVAMRMIIDETILDTTDPSLQEVAKRMESKFNKYWGNLEKVNKLVFLGHILDPRYKLQMIGIHLGDMKLDASKIQSFVDGLKNCLMELYHAYKGNSPLDHINGIDDGDVDKDLMEMYKNDPIKLNYHLKMAQLRKAQKQEEITNEVDKYFSDPFVKWSSSFDILEWWKGNTTTFPVLSKIAKDIFSIPSSTVASENAFSLGRRVVDPFRASLHPKMVEALVCTSDWLRGEEINLYKEPTEDEFNFYKDCEEVITIILKVYLFVITLFSPQMSDARISWAKNSILTTVVDDFFDIGGSREELHDLILLVEKFVYLCHFLLFDLISLHPVLDKTTYHLINKETLAIVKKEAILVNASRGPVIDEAALVEHLKANPMFSVGLNVFEDEPKMKPGLAEQKNAIVVPHIASASKVTNNTQIEA
ncbi:hypothetical protein ZIOFF_075050 [Zingiber officinale]|uniref:Transposase n=1 Tax=Zingiber officinale TaxID=94328 RepID=A0A8J5BTP6_ZINOF|nr:hypothetical protein ZIOFF_075050 [Zingiber officinale]